MDLEARARELLPDNSPDGYLAVYDPKEARAAAVRLAREALEEAARIAGEVATSGPGSTRYATAFQDGAQRVMERIRALASQEQPSALPKRPVQLGLIGQVPARRESGSIPDDKCQAGDSEANSGETKARADAGAHGAAESAADCIVAPADDRRSGHTEQPERSRSSAQSARVVTPEVGGSNPAREPPAASPRRVRIKTGWEAAGRRGIELARVFADQNWSVVLWDGDDDPDCFKSAGLESEQPEASRDPAGEACPRERPSPPAVPDRAALIERASIWLDCFNRDDPLPARMADFALSVLAERAQPEQWVRGWEACAKYQDEVITPALKKAWQSERVQPASDAEATGLAHGLTLVLAFIHEARMVYKQEPDGMKRSASLDAISYIEELIFDAQRTRARAALDREPVKETQ